MMWQVLDNLQHNVTINAALADKGPLFTKDIAATAQVHRLEWDEADALNRAVRTFRPGLCSSLIRAHCMATRSV
jgi:hypothetical protein